VESSGFCTAVVVPEPFLLVPLACNRRLGCRFIQFLWSVLLEEGTQFRFVAVGAHRAYHAKCMNCNRHNVRLFTESTECHGATITA
jgi:hypothetical protein